MPDHLWVLDDYIPDLGSSIVIGDPGAVKDIDSSVRAAESTYCEVVLRQLSIGNGMVRHDSSRLAVAFRGVMDDHRGDLAPFMELDNHQRDRLVPLNGTPGWCWGVTRNIDGIVGFYESGALKTCR